MILGLWANSLGTFWHIVPMILVVCLVYSATRHELPRPIFIGALRNGLWICGVMSVIFLILYAVSRNL